MARRRQFVSTGLHNISKHIAESTAGKGKVKSEEMPEDEVVDNKAEEIVVEEVVLDVVDEVVEESPDVEEECDVAEDEVQEDEVCIPEENTDAYVEPQSLMAHKKGDDLPERRDKQREKAVKRRANEFVNARRDMMTRISKSLAVIPDDIEECEMKIKLLQQYKTSYENLVLKLEPLDDSAWSDEDYSSELGKAMKVIENTRLEYLSSLARLEKMINGDESAVAVQSSFVADIASLTFAQLFRIGLGFTMPLICGIVFAAGIIALSYLVIVS